MPHKAFLWKYYQHHKALANSPCRLPPRSPVAEPKLALLRTVATPEPLPRQRNQFLCPWRMMPVAAKLITDVLQQNGSAIIFIT